MLKVKVSIVVKLENSDLFTFGPNLSSTKRCMTSSNGSAATNIKSSFQKGLPLLSKGGLVLNA